MGRPQSLHINGREKGYDTPSDQLAFVRHKATLYGQGPQDDSLRPGTKRLTRFLCQTLQSGDHPELILIRDGIIPHNVEL